MPVGTPRFKSIQPNVKDLSQHLRAIYAAATHEEATAALDRFEASWSDISGDRAKLARRMGPSDRAVRFSAGDSQSFLYQQCD
jgi:hypothetical protein